MLKSNWKPFPELFGVKIPGMKAGKPRLEGSLEHLRSLPPYTIVSHKSIYKPCKKCRPQK